MELHILMRLLASGAEEAIENHPDDPIAYGDRTMVVRINDDMYYLSPDITVTDQCVVLEVEDGERENGQYAH